MPTRTLQALSRASCTAMHKRWGRAPWPSTAHGPRPRMVLCCCGLPLCRVRRHDAADDALGQRVQLPCVLVPGAGRVGLAWVLVLGVRALCLAVRGSATAVCFFVVRYLFACGCLCCAHVVRRAPPALACCGVRHVDVRYLRQQAVFPGAVFLPSYLPLLVRTGVACGACGAPVACHQ
jgi:hypothetical protein